MDMSTYDILKEKKAVTMYRTPEFGVYYEIKQFDPLTGEPKETVKNVITQEDIIATEKEINKALQAYLKAIQNMVLFKTDIANLPVKTDIIEEVNG